MEEVNKSTKFVMFGLIGSVIAFLVIFALWDIFFGLSAKDFILNAAYSLDFKGRVDSVYRDENNHNVKTVILSSGFVYELYQDWEQDITKGDTLEKKISSYYVIVYKTSGEKIILDYRKLTMIMNDK